MFKKGNRIGQATRFGSGWPGQRCGAKTRSGTPCQKPALRGKARCQLHGGKSTGPRTEAGRARIAAAHTTHGRLTKEKRAEARRRAKIGREIRAELRDIAARAVAFRRILTKLPVDSARNQYRALCSCGSNRTCGSLPETWTAVNENFPATIGHRGGAVAHEVIEIHRAADCVCVAAGRSGNIR